MPHDNLSHAVRIWHEMKGRLATAYGLADDDQTLLDTLEGELDTRERIVRVLREAKATEAMAAGLNGLIAELKAREDRLEKTAQNMRATAAWAMQEIGEASIKTPDMTISFRMGKPGLVIDDARIDPCWTKQKIMVSPDREKIQAAVDNGDVPEGVEIRNPQPILTVRIK